MLRLRIPVPSQREAFHRRGICRASEQRPQPAELEQENPVEPPVPQQEQVSTTDPDSTYATKGGPARLGYYNNYLIDNSSCVMATPARLSHESLAARQMNRAPSATLRIGAAYTCCGHYVRQRRTAAMAGRSGYHPVHPGQTEPSEKKRLLWDRPGHPPPALRDCNLRAWLTAEESHQPFQVLHSCG